MPDLACSLVADHAGADGGARGAGLRKEPAVGRPGNAAQHFVAYAGRMFVHVPDLDIELLLRIVVLELRFQAKARGRYNGKAAPLDVERLEGLIHEALRLDVPFPGDRARVGVLHPVNPFADLAHRHEETEEDILRLEPRDDLRDGKLLVLLVAHHGTDVPGEKEPLERRLAPGKEPRHRRRDEPVAGEDREVLRRAGEDRSGDRRRGGLEPDRYEDDLPVGLPLCDLHRPVNALHHPDIPAARLKRALRPGDTQQVAVGGDGAAPFHKVERGVDLALRRDADRAPRSHHDLEPLGEDAPESGAGDRRFVGAADVHERYVPVDEIEERHEYILTNRHGSSYISLADRAYSCR